VALLWLSLRVRWRRAWARSLVVALLIGGVGGFILAAAATARDVQATYQTFVNEIDAPDLVVVPGCERLVTGYGCAAPPEPVSGAAMVEQLKRVAVVEQARSIVSVLPYFVDTDGQPLLATADDPTGCVDNDRSVALVPVSPGRAAAQPMPFRLDGKLPEPGNSGVVVTLATAERVGIRVGDSLRLAGWCDVDFDPVEMGRAMTLTVTGVSVGPLDIEPPGTGQAIEPAYVDPAVVDQLVAAGAETQTNTVIWLDRDASPDAVREGLAPYAIIIDLRDRAVVFDDALAGDAQLLWVLAGVGAVGAVLLLAPIVGRHLRETAGNTTVLAALGTTRKQAVAQSLTHVGALGLLGGLLAAVLTPVISSFMPRGFAVTIAPHPPLEFDAALTAIGVVLLVIAVVAMGALAAWRTDSSGETKVPQFSDHRGIAIASSHLRPAARSGVLTAVGTPAGPREASPWPSFISLAVAGVTCVASLTYLAGLNHFERTPSLVGWNWDARVAFNEEASDVAPSILARLGDIDGVETVTAGTVYPPMFLAVADTEITVWPWSFDTGSQAITPSMVSGRAPDGPDELAINAVFARATNLGVGDSVAIARPALVTMLADLLEQGAFERGLPELALNRPDDAPVVAKFEITGIAVLPLQRTQDFAQATFTLDGLAAMVEPSDDEARRAGEWLPEDLPGDLPSEARNILANTGIVNRGAYLRLTGDQLSTASAITQIEGVEEVAGPSPEQVLTLVVGLNISHNDRVPLALVNVVSIAAAALLCYLLYTAVRARRFELAVMRALGLSNRGVRWSMVAQATATAVVPLIVAIPLGIAIGRRAWTTSAHNLDVVAVSVTPWSALVVLVASAIVIANLVVLVPGWALVKRSPGADLRAG
jgi:hypothetical protein